MTFFARTRLALGALALSPLPLAIAAAPVAAQEDVAAYEDLYESMDEGVDLDLALDATMKVVRREYAAVPAIAQMEKISPGLIDEIVKEMRPVFRDYQARVRELYRPRMVSVFARNLTPTEATDIAAFYRSDIGKRILNGVSRNFSPDASLENVSEIENQSDEEIREDVQTDISNASAATVAELSQEDLLAIGRMAMEKPALLKLNSINPQIITLRAEMEKEPPIAEEEARIQAVIEDVFARRLGE